MAALSAMTEIGTDDLISLGTDMSSIKYAQAVLNIYAPNDDEPVPDNDTEIKSVNKKDYPSWVDLYEKEGYIGQNDNNYINYIGYGEGVTLKQARSQAIQDAYNKAMAAITGYADGKHPVPVRNMKLSSEFKNQENKIHKVWQIYRYPRAQLDEDIKKYMNKN